MKLKTLVLVTIISVNHTNLAFANTNKDCNIIVDNNVKSICVERFKLSAEMHSIADKDDYNFFYNQGTKLKTLVNSGQYLKASKLFTNYKDEYFLKKPRFSNEIPAEKYRKTLTEVVNVINSKYEKEIIELINLLNNINSNGKEARYIELIDNVATYKDNLRKHYLYHNLLDYKNKRHLDSFVELENLINKSKKISPYTTTTNDIEDESTSLAWGTPGGYIFIGLIIIFFLIDTFYSTIKKAKKPSPEEQKLLELWLSKVKQIEKEHAELESYLNENSGYFSNYQLTEWLGKNKQLFDEVQTKAYNKVRLSSSNLETINKFVSAYQNAPSLRKKFNDYLKLLELWLSKVKQIEKEHAELESYLNENSGYFSNYQLTEWLGKNKQLFDEVQTKAYNKVRLSSSNLETINKFVSAYQNAPSLREQYNISFVKNEIITYSAFFDNIEGKKLDEQQRKAVITNEDNNLIIAGAGSGKTTTIVGKVHYLLDKYKTNIDEIILISFTRESANTLRKRIGLSDVKVKTFHAFGLEILNLVDNKKAETFEEYKFKPLLTKLLKLQLKNTKYINTVNTFTTEYLQKPKSQFEFDSRGEYYKYLRDKNFTTYKLVRKPGLTTFKREVVKSIEECKIANFLLFNGVEYKYEEPYDYHQADNYARYKPDFTIFQDGNKIYLEHFGINSKGQVPPFFAKEGETHQQATQRYTDGMKWKINKHKEHSTLLIETFSHEMWRNDDVFYDILKQRLIDAGVVLKPKTPEEIWQLINEFNRSEEKDLINLFSTFITLMKSNQYSIQAVKDKAEEVKDIFYRKRSELFLDIIQPIYDGYEAHLTKKNVIDFSDMINIATEYIADNKYTNKISYVIIDEFQDISIGRYNLVKAIKATNPHCRLFCVGDDWQSIFRFTGSDLSLFKNFEKFFGVTEKLKIETTYRFHTPLIEMSSKFIQKNPIQAKKNLRDTSSSLQTIDKVIYSNNDDTAAIISIFKEITDIYKDITKKKITILGRHNFDIQQLVRNENNELFIKEDSKKNITVTYMEQTNNGVETIIKANYLTVHKAKGLEADIVIIINCNSGKFGFPNLMVDDDVLNLLLSESDPFENGEERRLFYVAMTRAKELIYFITDSYNKSKFILEIEKDEDKKSLVKCPFCKVGNLLPKSYGITSIGSKYVFYGCTNYEYGCKYRETKYSNKSGWIEEDYIILSAKSNEA